MSCKSPGSAADRQTFRQIEFDRTLRRVGKWQNKCGSLARRPANIDHVEAGLIVCFGDLLAGEIEQLADDAGHPGDVLLDLLPVRRAAEMRLLQTQTEHSQRRTQFMRGIGDEAALGVIGPGHAVKRCVDGGDQRADLARQPVDGNPRLRIPRANTSRIARCVLQVPQGPAADQDNDADCRRGEDQQDQDVLIGILDPVDVEMTE